MNAENRRLCEINTSVAFVASLLLSKSKTHINKVQHLTNKLSQSSLAVLGESYAREVWDSQSSVLYTCTCTHTHTRWLARSTTHTVKRKLEVSPADVSFSGDSSRDGASSRVLSRRSDRTGLAVAHWPSAASRLVAAHETSLTESESASPRTPLLGNQSFLKSATGS